MFDYVFHILACAPFLRLASKSPIKFWDLSLTRFLNVNETNVIDIQDYCHWHLFKMSLTFFPVSMTFTSNVNDIFSNVNDIFSNVNDIFWSVNDIWKTLLTFQFIYEFLSVFISYTSSCYNIRCQFSPYLSIFFFEECKH